MRKLLIKNGLCVNEGVEQIMDIRIRGERIENISASLDPIDDEEVYDATGCYVLPGVIDDQVHFREPGLTHKGNIYTESRAAVAGGVTSFFEMPNTNPQTTDIPAWESKMKIAAENSMANYAFMFGGTNDNLHEIRKIDTKQIPALKLFLGSSTGNMLVDDEEVLRSIFSEVKIPIALHCEDEDTIRENLASAKAKYGDDIPMDQHPIIRSEEACYLSSAKAIRLAKETGARIHVFHLSTGKETHQFESGQDPRDKPYTSEVCIHHLWFSDEDYAEKGSLIKWNPAVKTAHDREEIWEALLDDRIDIIATDHAPHTLEEKSNKYLTCPSGGPLVQHTLLAMLHFVGEGRLSASKMVEKMCHNPAKLFDIEERGYLREGYFADIAIVQKGQEYKVSQENILAKCGWSPFEGHEFDNTIAATIVNGAFAYRDGQVASHSAAKAMTFAR
jgi:dihydroorotase